MKKKLKTGVLCFFFSAAFDYLKSHPVDPVDVAEFEHCCGVGVVVTQEEIDQQVWYSSCER